MFQTAPQTNAGPATDGDPVFLVECPDRTPNHWSQGWQMPTVSTKVWHQHLKESGCTRCVAALPERQF